MLCYRNWLVRLITGSSGDVSASYEYEFDDDDDDDKEKEEKKSLKERLQAIQEVSQSVQNTIGYLASLGESTKKYTLILKISSQPNTFVLVMFLVHLISPSRN